MIGLEGNLGRAPRTGPKPNAPARDTEPIHAPYERNESFDGKMDGVAVEPQSRRQNVEPDQR